MQIEVCSVQSAGVTGGGGGVCGVVAVDERVWLWWEGLVASVGGAVPWVSRNGRAALPLPAAPYPPPSFPAAGLHTCSLQHGFRHSWPPAPMLEGRGATLSDIFRCTLAPPSSLQPSHLDHVPMFSTGHRPSQAAACDRGHPWSCRRPPVQHQGVQPEGAEAPGAG